MYLLAVLYKNQIDGKEFFDIRRGVKQGDTLSAMLFNAAIEVWKSGSLETDRAERRGPIWTR